MKYTIISYNHGLHADSTLYNGMADSTPVTIEVLDDHKIEVNTNGVTLTGDERISITGVKVKRTIVIHKSMTVYCDRSYVPDMYMSVSEDFYAVYEDKCYQHNIGLPNKFNGERKRSVISYTVSGLQGEQSYMAYEKIFESVMLETTGTKPWKAFFKTDYQYSSYSFNESALGKKPEYTNQSWYFPIFPSELKYKDYMAVKRNLQGRNLVVSVHLNVDENKNIFVRSAVTNFKVIGF